MKDYRFSNNTAKRRYELDLEDGQIAFKALTDIREQGSKVIPQCGFVASYIRRHPEYDDPAR